MVNNSEIETKRLKQEILIRLIRAFMSDNFAENARLIPYDMRPKGADNIPFRCCVYKEREILRSRTLAGLGFGIEEDDEKTLLSEYAKRALERETPEENPLTIIGNACKGCPGGRVYITDLCQNCLAKPCINTCRFGAIKQIDGRSVIDEEKCKKCGLCMSACPYGAIIKTISPCENACPVGAIEKDENGFAKIDKEKCISCGKCVSACPFGAVHVKSQIIDVLKRIKDNQKVIALLAPALMGHLPFEGEQIKQAFIKAGFTDVYEVALGADITAKTEAQDLKERLLNNAPFMTTSCCAAYNEFVKKHLPQIKPFVSDAYTPLYYTAEIVKKEHPDAITVFISPCFAKRLEVLENPNVDYILNFEEINAILTALDIEIETCSSESLKYQTSKEGREFAISGGVAKAVQACWNGNPEDLKPVIINGLNKVSIRDLKKYAKEGKCDLGNLIEIMSCEGGCIAGNACLLDFKNAFKQIKSYGEKGHSINDK